MDTHTYTSSRSVAERAANPASQPARPVDLAHLARYTMGDVALQQEVLALFVKQAPLTIERFSLARSEKQWREAAHTLKGSARAIGAWRLAAAAEASEQVDGWLHSDDAAEAIAKIGAAFADVAAFIAELWQPAAA